MIKTKLTLLLAAAALCGCTALAQNNTGSQTIETGHLRGVTAHSGFEVTLQQGPVSGAVITVDSRLQPYLRAKVDDGVLDIGFDNLPRDLQRVRGVRKATVTVTTFEKAKAHSGARISGNGSFTARECEFEAHSGAMIDRIDVTAKEVEVSVHSGARAVVSGTTDKLEAETASGSTADLSRLQAKDVQADASSGSSLRCCATNSIKGRASSGASVRYTGGATHVNTGSSSGGSYGPVK
ncbi:MAG: DUF2807 domain-containing protein [Rikenellaceae bacterium]|nr:DUF2807 domain-containing protein [Rikenellaceae bacterium]